jgi:hypothetical protein
MRCGGRPCWLKARTVELAVRLSLDHWGLDPKLDARQPVQPGGKEPHDREKQTVEGLTDRDADDREPVRDEYRHAGSCEWPPKRLGGLRSHAAQHDPARRANPHQPSG